MSILKSDPNSPLITALKKMTHGFVFVIEVQCVTLIDSLKDLGERRLAGFDQEMDVVVHEHIGIQMIMIAVPIDEEELEKFIVVGGLFKDSFAAGFPA